MFNLINNLSHTGRSDWAVNCGEQDDAKRNEKKNTTPELNRRDLNGTQLIFVLFCFGFGLGDVTAVQSADTHHHRSDDARKNHAGVLICCVAVTETDR